jgi:hypothetical protein
MLQEDSLKFSSLLMLWRTDMLGDTAIKSFDLFIMFDTFDLFGGLNCGSLYVEAWIVE